MTTGYGFNAMPSKAFPCLCALALIAYPFLTGQGPANPSLDIQVHRNVIHVDDWRGFEMVFRTSAAIAGGEVVIVETGASQNLIQQPIPFDTSLRFPNPGYEGTFQVMCYRQNPQMGTRDLLGSTLLTVTEKPLIEIGRDTISAYEDQTSCLIWGLDEEGGDRVEVFNARATPESRTAFQMTADPESSVHRLALTTPAPGTYLIQVFDGHHDSGSANPAPTSSSTLIVGEWIHPGYPESIYTSDPTIDVKLHGLKPGQWADLHLFNAAVGGSLIQSVEVSHDHPSGQFDTPEKAGSYWLGFSLASLQEGQQLPVRLFVKQALSAPGPVTGIQATVTGSRQVKLHWEHDGSGGEVRYEVEKIEPNGNRTVLSRGGQKDHLHSGLAPQAKVNLAVTAYNDVGRGAATAIEVGTPEQGPPPVPHSLAFTWEDQNTYVVDWAFDEAVEGPVDHYVVQRRSLSEQREVETFVVTTAWLREDALTGSVQLGESYGYSVTAVNDVGASLASEEIQFHTIERWPAPHSFVTRAIDGLVHLSWNHEFFENHIPTKWLIQRKLADTPDPWKNHKYLTCFRCPGGASSRDSRFLTPGETYWYRVRAERPYLSHYTARSEVYLPLRPNYIQWRGPTILGPNSVKIEIEGPREGDPADVYHIYRSTYGYPRIGHTSSRVGSVVPSGPGGEAEFIDSELTPSTKYYYRFTGENGGGESLDGGRTSVTTPDAPPPPGPASPVLSGSRTGPEQVTLEWRPGPVNDDFGPPDVYRVHGGPLGDAAFLEETAALTLTVDGLSDADFYQFYVIALNASGAAESSPVVVQVGNLPDIRLSWGNRRFDEFTNPGSFWPRNHCFTVAIHNDGMGPLYRYKLQFYRSDDPILSDDDRNFYNGVVISGTGLAAGDTTAMRACDPFDGSEQESEYLIVQATVLGGGEANPENNDLTRHIDPITSSGPDLHFAALMAPDGLDFGNNGSKRFECVIQNTGTEPTPLLPGGLSAFAGFNLITGALGPHQVIGQFDVPSLQPGQSMTLSNLLVTIPSEFNDRVLDFGFILDKNKLLQEGDEYNNRSATLQISIGAPENQ